MEIFERSFLFPEYKIQNSIITSGNASLCLQMENCNVDIDTLLNSEDFRYRIPNLHQEIEFKKKKILSFLRFSGETDQISINWNGERLEVKYGDTRLKSNNDKYLIRDLVWILLPVLEYSRQYNKQYLLHASAVEINKKVF